MIRTQRLALATELVRNLPPVGSAVVRTVWRMIRESPEESLAGIRETLDVSSYQAVEARWKNLSEFEAKFEFWSEKGIEFLFPDDPHFPQSWASVLGTRAPYVLGVVGDASLLNQRGVGIVGSRDAGEASKQFAKNVASEAVRLGYGIISGGAKGIDQIGMSEGLAQNGTAVGFTPELWRSHCVWGHVPGLCLASPYAPDASFSAGIAMARNKLIYASAAITIVVESAVRSGGTWTGAKEAISKQYGDVAAWANSGPGCDAILEMGAKRIQISNELANLIENGTEFNLFSRIES